MAVEAIQHILVLDSLIIAVLQSRKRNAEAVLSIFQVNTRSIYQRLIYALVNTWTDKHIMNLQVFKIHRNLPVHRHLLRIEDGKTVCTSENQSSISKSARRPVIELISSDSVIRKPVGKLSCSPVIHAKTILSTDPKIAGLIFLYRRNIKTWSSGHMNKFILAEIKPEQSVREGSDPHHTVSSLMHA